MTEENFKRAKELNARIRHLEFELSAWENSVELVSIKIKDGIRGKTTDMRNDESLVDFQPVKELVIKELSKKLEAAKSEFEKL